MLGKISRREGFMPDIKHVAAGFCAACAAESDERTPGDISTTNGVGRKFYGGARPCVECGSVVRTLWWVFVDVPLVPLGSYRYKTIQDEGLGMKRFWTRRTRTHWDQIFKTWAVGWAAAAAAVAAFLLYQKLKGE
jgi:hypothetical protein